MVEVHYQNIEEIPGLSSEFLFSWFTEVCKLEGKELAEVNLIFMSDDDLLEMNRTHLDHDYYTDIITFDYCEEDLILGDLFISVDRVRDNAEEFKVSFGEELKRVCVHGVLHLCGYGDKSEEDERMMRAKENEMLELTVSRETII